MRIIGACSEEVIADHEHGGGRPHWAILEDLGRRIGLSRRGDPTMPACSLSTQLCWLAWEALMSNRHWLEGLIANTCAERANIPGYGEGVFRKRGWFGLERQRWGKLFDLTGRRSSNSSSCTRRPTSSIPISAGRRSPRKAERHGVADQVVHACRINLLVWEQYLDGIAAGGDALDRGKAPAYV